MDTLLAELAEIAGPEHVLTDPDLVAGYTTDWTRRFSGAARAVIRPADAAQVAAALLAFFNQMVFVQSRIAMLDICALTFALLGIAAFMHGFRKQRPDRQKRITTTSEISHSPDVTRTSQIGTNDPVRTCGLRLGEVRAQKDGFTTLRAILLLVSA